MDALVALRFLAGMGLLLAGGELLVRGASRLARGLGMSPLMVGLTVVAYGTSAPELAVTVKAAFTGGGDLALGNVVGSNIINVLLVCGLSALAAPLIVSHQLVRSDVPILIGASALVLLLGLDGRIGRIDGALLACGAATYTWLVIRSARRETNPVVQAEYAQAFPPAPRATSLQLGMLLATCAAGLVLLVLGTRWLVASAVAIATALGVSQLVIGLTIVAVGTSLPELVASLVAAMRGERDIAVGNVVGSSIYNILAILGIAAVVTPGGIDVPPHALWVDIPIMIGTALACLPIFFTGHCIARWEGAVFVAYYAAYTTYLVLKAKAGYEATLHLFVQTMLLFVLPLTVLTLTVTTWRAIRARR